MGKINYAYTKDVTKEDYASRHGLNLYYLFQVDYDTLDRFYYGFNLHIYGENNSFNLTDNITTTEFRGQLGIGPSITYDAFKKEKFTVTFTSAITMNYDRTFINQQDQTEKEERIFEALSFTPKIGSLVSIKDFLPFGHLVMGSEIQYNMKNKIMGSKSPEINRFWNEDEDYITRPLGATFAFYFGIMATN